MAYGKIKADTLIYDNSGSDVEVTLASIGNKAPLASPTFTGTVTIPTPSSGDDSTKAASTAFVVAGFAPKASPALTGTATGVNLTLSGNLTVNGTTTTINSTTLTVDDKNIELGTVDTPSDTTADGGGITLKGATDKTITWTNATDTWDFNQNIKITSGYLQVYGTEAGAAEVYLYADEGDDNADKWRIKSDTSGNFQVANYSSGGWSTGYSIDGSNNSTFYGSVSDTKGDVRKIPRELKSSAYTLVAADAGKCIATDSGVTVPHNVLGTGDAVTIVNNSSSDITITQASSLTIHNSADASTGNRTLASKGMATIWFSSGAEAFISGAGLS